MDVGGDLRVGSWAGIPVDFAETGRECDGGLWLEMVWFAWNGLRRGVFPALAVGGSLLSSLGLSLFER